MKKKIVICLFCCLLPLWVFGVTMPQMTVEVPRRVVQGEQFEAVYKLYAPNYKEVALGASPFFEKGNAHYHTTEYPTHYVLELRVQLVSHKAGEVAMPRLQAMVNSQLVQSDTTITVVANTDYNNEYKIGENWLRGKISVSDRPFSIDTLSMYVAYKNDYFVVFHNRVQKVFVVVARKKFWKELGNPILAWSDRNDASSTQTNHFDFYIPQLRRLKRGTSNLYKYLPYQAQAMKRAPILGEVAWSQQAPYNQVRVLNQSSETVTGCVPVAVGQLMRHYQYPKQVDTYSYYMDNNGTDVYRVAFADFFPKWEGMRDRYAETEQQEGLEAAKLLTMIGLGVNASFGVSNTGASLKNVKSFLCPSMHYSGRMTLYTENDLSAAVRIALLYREIDEGRACIVSTATHAFVVDGYDGDFLHYNLGWGGRFTGYYRTLLSADYLESDLFYLTEMVIGIEPEQPYEKTVTLQQAGQLGQALTDWEKEHVTSLTINGYLNNDDIRVLRHMAGFPLPHPLTDRTGSLKELNLQNAQFVTDMKSFFYYCPSTAKLEIPELGRVFDFSKKMSVEDWQRVQQYSTLLGNGYYVSWAADGSCYDCFYTKEDIISPRMFSYCTSLEHITLPRSINRICSGAFFGCSDLLDIDIPRNVQSVGSDSFSFCSVLRAITFVQGAVDWERPNFNSCSPAFPFKFQ